MWEKDQREYEGLCVCVCVSVGTLAKTTFAVISSCFSAISVNKWDLWKKYIKVRYRVSQNQQILTEPKHTRVQINITKKAICLCDNSHIFQGAGVVRRYCFLNALTLVVWGYVLFCQGSMSLVFSSGPYGGEVGWRQPSSHPTGIGKLARPLISSYPCAWQRRGFRISTLPRVKKTLSPITL